MATRQELEQQLNDFDPAVRGAALKELTRMAKDGEFPIRAPGPMFNMHCHTFFSFNGYGYSPSCLAWMGCKNGLSAMGTVDFDSLDAAEEFLDACEELLVPACAGLETRVYVEQFDGRTMNSPGEPGISYQVGIGFTGGEIAQAEVLERLKSIAAERTRGIVERVNPYLSPIELDYEQEVLPFTPNGNATERHVCMAYDQKARDHFPNEEELAAFWAGKLEVTADAIIDALKEPPVFQGLIRAKTMKAGGVGYVAGKKEDFPSLEEVNRFILANGALPAYAFLDGTSGGEASLEELIDVMMMHGVVAATIIPDRNWNIKDPVVKNEKVAKFDAFVEKAKKRHLPILVGTEMNAYGQRFVDDFSAPEMQKHYEVFREGVEIIHAHTQMQKAAGMGYVSEWANKELPYLEQRYMFYQKVGQALIVGEREIPPDLAPTFCATDVFAAL